MPKFKVAVPIEAYKIIEIDDTHDTAALAKACELVLLLDGETVLLRNYEPWEKPYGIKGEYDDNYMYVKKNHETGKWEKVYRP